MLLIHETPLPPPDLAGNAGITGGHASAFSLIFIYLAVAGIGGVLLGNLLTERYLRGRVGPELTYGRQIVINAFTGVACALVIFAVLSFGTMLVMKFMV